MSANATSDTGVHLRADRLAAGLSQQQLAMQADCSISMLRLLEGGYVPASSEVLDRLRAALCHSNTSDAAVSTGSR